MMDRPKWIDYAVYYPCEDEEGYDGEHDGGIKGIKMNAPDDVKKEYAEYIKASKDGMKI